MCFHPKILHMSSTLKMNLQCLKLPVELNLIISTSKTSVCNRVRKEISNTQRSEANLSKKNYSKKMATTEEPNSSKKRNTKVLPFMNC